MRDIEKRLRAIEQRAYYAENQVCVLMPTEDGLWRLTLNGKDRYFRTKEEGETVFRQLTGPDSVLIVWG